MKPWLDLAEQTLDRLRRELSGDGKEAFRMCDVLAAILEGIRRHVTESPGSTEPSSSEST